MIASDMNGFKTVKNMTHNALSECQIVFVNRQPLNIKVIDNRCQFHQPAFAHADIDRAKNTDNFTVFLALLGSARVKAARRTLIKLTTEL